MLRRTFSAFHHRDFRLMWAGACTSSIGTWMQKAAQSWLVYRLSGSESMLGLDAFLGEIPILLFSLFGGVVADRRDRRQILLASQFVQMSCAFVLAFLVAQQAARVEHILCLSFIVGTAQAFGGPAYQALIPSLVKSENLSNAIALNSIQFNLARVIGPTLGGIALARLGEEWCFALNGISFLAVIVSLLLLEVRHVPGLSQEGVFASMRQGIGFVRRHPIMPTLVGMAFVVTLLGIPLSVFLPVFAKDVFHQGPTTFTLLLSTFGAGSIVGALLVAGLGQHATRGRTALLALVALGAAMAGFSMSRHLPASLALLFLAGACLVATSSLVSTMVQELSTDQMRGRVMSVFNVAFRGGMPVGSLLTGILAPRLSTPLTLAGAGVLLSVLGLGLLVFRRDLAGVSAAGGAAMDPAGTGRSAGISS